MTAENGIGAAGPATSIKHRDAGREIALLSTECAVTLT
jgi:hypothetical protein